MLLPLPNSLRRRRPRYLPSATVPTMVLVSHPRLPPGPCATSPSPCTKHAPRHHLVYGHRHQVPLLSPRRQRHLKHLPAPCTPAQRRRRCRLRRTPCGTVRTAAIPFRMKAAVTSAPHSSHSSGAATAVPAGLAEEKATAAGTDGVGTSGGPTRPTPGAGRAVAIHRATIADGRRRRRTLAPCLALPSRSPGGPACGHRPTDAAHTTPGLPHITTCWPSGVA